MWFADRQNQGQITQQLTDKYFRMAAFHSPERQRRALQRSCQINWINLRSLKKRSVDLTKLTKRCIETTLAISSCQDPATIQMQVILGPIIRDLLRLKEHFTMWSTGEEVLLDPRLMLRQTGPGVAGIVVASRHTPHLVAPCQMTIQFMVTCSMTSIITLR